MAAQEPIQIARSKNRHSILFCYYRSVLLEFCGGIALMVLIPFIDRGWDAVRWEHWGGYMSVVLLCIGFFTFCYAWNGKGNLVESLTIDFEERIVLVSHYRLPATKCQSRLPLDGLTWDVRRSARGVDRLRLKPREGKRMVICIDHLGWTYDDCYNLMVILDNLKNKEIQHAI